MSLADFLAGIIRVLEEVRVPYMLTGSLATAYYASPRSTQDVDLVIEATDAQIDGLVDGLSAEGPLREPSCSVAISSNCSRAWGRHSIAGTYEEWDLQLGLESAWRTVLERLGS